MSDRSEATLGKRLAEIRDRAAGIATELGATARGLTSAGIERATLRLFGVGGLDPQGQPLAATVVERFAQLGPARFGGGIALPYAAAAAEYDLEPQELAIDIARGNIDLALEADLLEVPERRFQAERQVARWAAHAFARFDANRTARHELADTLGEPATPWIGAWLAPLSTHEATAEAASLVAAGADLVVVRVPATRELVLGRLEEAAAELPLDVEPPPPGSQRGLAGLRATVDEAAAERGAYARLATTTEGLAAPEQAVVAGLERVDLVIADPLEEMDAGVAPERALADHAAAHALVGRSGAQLLLGPGAPLFGPELARGEVVDAATRAGRSLAAQAVAVAFALDSGLEARQVLLGVPAESPEGPSAAAQALADVALRRLLYPDLSLAVAEPLSAEPSGWSTDLAAWLVALGRAQLVLRQGGPAEFHQRAAEARASLRAAAAVREGLLGRGADGVPAALVGPAAEHALRVAEAAIATLRIVAAEGWEPLIGAPPGLSGAGSGERLGGAGLVPRRGYVGPLAASR